MMWCVPPVAVRVSAWRLSGATRRLVSLPLPGRSFLTNLANANGRTSDPVPIPVGGVLGTFFGGALLVDVDVDVGELGGLNTLLTSSWAFLPAFSASSNGTPMTTAATTSDTSVAIGLRPRPPPTVRPAETFDSWIGGRPEPAGCWGGGG